MNQKYEIYMSQRKLTSIEIDLYIMRVNICHALSDFLKTVFAQYSEKSRMRKVYYVIIPGLAELFVLNRACQFFKR